MKHQIETIDSAQWLRIVNSEAHPDAQTYELHHYRIGQGIMSVLISGVGRIQTPMYTPPENITPEELDAVIDQNIEDIKKQHKIQMDRYGFAIGRNSKEKMEAENHNNNPNALRSPFSPF